VIPREGVESSAVLYDGEEVTIVAPVIPREGVESNITCLGSIDACIRVIPREGVERSSHPRKEEADQEPVIPREGVESRRELEEDDRRGYGP